MRRNLRSVLRWIVVGRPTGFRAEVRRRAGCFEWLDRGRPEAANGEEDRPDPREVLIRLDELPPGTVAEVVVDGRPVALANVDGEIIGIDGTCPHAGGPLGDGQLEGCVLTCPWHGWSYDLKTLRSLVDDGVSLAAVPVEVVDGAVVAAKRPAPSA